jgi:hypothetical protein
MASWFSGEWRMPSKLLTGTGKVHDKRSGWPKAVFPLTHQISGSDDPPDGRAKEHLVNPEVVMFKKPIVGTAACLSLAFLAMQALAEEPKSKNGPANKLVGTWKLISAKYGGQDFKFPEGVIMLKHVTPEQFTWLRYGSDGKVTDIAGGGCTIKGNQYEEAPEYGLGDSFEVIKGKTHSFEWKVAGNKWYHSGKLANGLTIEEVWERVEKK